MISTQLTPFRIVDLPVALLALCCLLVSPSLSQSISLSKSCSASVTSMDLVSTGVFVDDPMKPFFLFTHNRLAGTGVSMVAVDLSCNIILTYPMVSDSAIDHAVFFTQYRFALTPRDRGFKYMEYSISSGVVSLTNMKSNTDSRADKYTYGIGEKDTSYAYFSRTNALGNLGFVKIDANGASTSPMMDVSTGYTKIMYRKHWYTSNSILSTTDDGFIITSKSDLSVYWEYVDPKVHRHLHRRSASSNQYFSTSTAGGMFKFTMDYAAKTVTPLGTASAGTTFTNIVGLSFYNIIIGVSGDASASTVFIHMDTMTVLSTTNLVSKVFEGSAVSGPKLSRGYLFAGFEATGATVSIYKPLVDYCLVAAENPCQRCVSNRYLTGIGVTDNECLTPAEFPSNYGPYLGLSYELCLNSSGNGCLKCPLDNQACKVCDTANSFYLNPLDGRCYQTYNMPDGIGLNTALNRLSRCTIKMCKVCKNNYQVCEECWMNFYRKEDGTPGCFSNVYDRLGPKYGMGGGTLAPCSVVNCKSCRYAYNLCLLCELGYVLNNNGVCVVDSSYTPGKGLNTTNPGIPVNCLVTNCYDCRSDYRYCSRCSDGYFFLLYDNSQCLPNTQPLQGPIISTGAERLGPCQVSSCQKCTVYYENCDECNPNKYTKVLDLTTCSANTLTGYGLDTTFSPPKLEICANTTCIECYTNRDSCDNLPLFPATCPYPTFDDFGTCDPLPSGKGLDASGNVVLCSDSNCEVCWSDQTECDVCKTDYYHRLPSIGKLCYFKVLDGWGLDDTPTQVPGETGNVDVLRGCADIMCKNCSAKYDECSECLADYYLLEGSTTGCQQVTPLSRMGLKNVTGQVPLLATCIDPDCYSCQWDYQGCTECTIGYYVLDPAIDLLPDTSRCIQSVMDGFGLIIGSNPSMITVCTVGHCKDCGADHTVCMECEDDYLFLENSSTLCLPENEPGYAAVEEQGIKFLRPCLITGCKNCQFDVSCCLECQGALVFFPPTKSCSVPNPVNFIELLNKPMVSRSTGEFNLLFSDEVQPVDFLERLDVVVDMTNGDVVQASKYSLELRPASLGSGNKKVFGVLKSSMHGNLDMVLRVTLRLKKSSNHAFFNNFKIFDPRAVIEVPIESINTTQKASKNAIPAVIVGSLVAINSITSFKAGSGASRLSYFIKVIDLVEYVLYTDGVRIIKSDSFLHQFSVNILAILPNVFAISEDKLSCVPSNNFAREGISCYFLNSFGSDLFTLLAIFTVVGLFKSLSSFGEYLDGGCKKISSSGKDDEQTGASQGKTNIPSRKRQSLFSTILKLPYRVFNFAFALALFDGCQFDVFRQAFVNLASKSDSSGVAFGRVISVLLIFLYCCLAAIYFVYASRLSKHGTVMEGRAAKFLLSFKDSFDDLRKPTSNTRNIYLYLPAFMILYGLVSQLLLVLLDGIGTTQFYVFLVIDLVYGVFLWKLKPFIQLWRNIMLVAVMVGLASIDSILLFANSLDVSYKVREDNLAYYLIGLFVAVVFCGALPLIVNIYEAIYNSFKSFKIRLPRPSVSKVVQKTSDKQVSVNSDLDRTPKMNVLMKGRSSERFQKFNMAKSVGMRSSAMLLQTSLSKPVDTKIEKIERKMTVSGKLSNSRKTLEASVDDSASGQFINKYLAKEHLRISHYPTSEISRNLIFSKQNSITSMSKHFKGTASLTSGQDLGEGLDSSSRLLGNIRGSQTPNNMSGIFANQSPFKDQKLGNLKACIENRHDPSEQLLLKKIPAIGKQVYESPVKDQWSQDISQTDSPENGGNSLQSSEKKTV